MPPIWTNSNLPFSKTRVSSGFSNRFRMTSLVNPPIAGPPELISESPACFFGLNLSQHFTVFLVQLRSAQQIGTITHGLLQCAAATPLSNLIVVPIHQHFGNLHAVKRCRPRVVRIIQQPA